MSEENWIDWPSGAELHNLPVGSLVGYPKAAYERTSVGLRCYWSGTTANVLGRDFTLDGGWTVPERVFLPRGYRFSGSEVVKDEPKPVSVPASLAGAVGLEKYANEAYAQAIRSQWIGAQQGGLFPSDYVSRQGNYQQQVQIQLGTCPECTGQGWNPLAQSCGCCGATAKSIEAKRSKPACKCGATENVRPIAVEYVTSWGKKQYGGEDICAPCYVARRRAQLQAEKLERAKRDLDRPSKRDPYEWLGFSSPSWEE